MERKAFDNIMEHYFPGAPRHRQDTKTGWIDTIEIGAIVVEVAVLHTTSRGSPRATGVGAYIRVQSDTKGQCLIRSQQEHPCDLDATIKVLTQLKKNLLGISAAITMVCGIGLEPSEDFDVDEFIREPKNLDIGDILASLKGVDEDDLQFD